ncbi:MAG: class I SAM-dependent methyltransferase [Solirubrobacteraceae bacterium]
MRPLVRGVVRRARAVRRQLELAVARLPLLRAKERVYTAAFYLHADPVHRPMYESLADVLFQRFEPASVVDVGCGIGRMLARFEQHGVAVTGVEGSRHAIASSPVAGRIVRANLERCVPTLGRFDICLCIEVAEHLPPRAAPALVVGLCGLSDIVVFTAAPPGQGGIHHVNERPHVYWAGLFAAERFARSVSDESAVKASIAGIPEPSWMHANLLVFRREGGTGV